MSILKSKTSRTQFLDSLRNKVKQQDKSYQADTRFWKLDVDKTGVGSATIRFLPNVDPDPCPYEVLYTHGFKGSNGKFYIENCPTSIKGVCPACVSNTALWQTGIEANKKIVSERKRKLSYISNILVINDPKHPENNGKVFLYKYGKSIFEKIKDVLEPMDEDSNAVNPFCPLEGANFKLKMTKGANGFPTFEKSQFDAPTPLFGGDESRITALEPQMHSLSEVLNPKNFKSVEELQARLNSVIGTSASSTTQEVSEEAAPARKSFKSTPAKATSRVVESEAEGEDEEDFFANLAREEE